MTKTKTAAWRLKGTVQHYAWGGFEYIPKLVGLPAQPGVPYAEYWLGAHPKASGMVVVDGIVTSLDKLIAGNSEQLLGVRVVQCYGRLPFLLKILDVREMLSIQVHPTKADAEAGFARENALGIPLDAPERNYKDDNHKPELQLALSDFWLLHGFRPAADLRQTLAAVPELAPLLAHFVHDDYRELYEYAMTMPDEEAAALLRPLANRLLPLYQASKLPIISPDYWAAKALSSGTAGRYDRGIFSLYFFNLVKLEPGQALFQGAGVPHALLQGQAIEIMANSDNVVRGGLTPKTVDIPELLRLVRFQSTATRLINSQQDGAFEELFVTPIEEFCLGHIQLPDKTSSYRRDTESLEIVYCLSGEVTLESSEVQIVLKRGESAVIGVGQTYSLSANTDAATILRAFVKI